MGWMLKRTGPPLAALLVVTGAGSAQQAPALRLADALAAALARHPSAALADAALARADAGVREASASLLPGAAVDMVLTRHQEPMVVAPLHGFDPRNPPDFDRTLAQAGLSVVYTLFDGGARGARQDRAVAVRAGAGAQRELARQALLADVVIRYGAVLVARELEAAHVGRAAALERERERAASLLAQGRAARVVLLRAEAELSGAQAERAAAVARTAAAERGLARVMGVPASSVIGASLVPLGPLEPGALPLPPRPAEPPSGLPPSGLPPSGLPPSGLPPSGLLPQPQPGAGPPTPIQAPANPELARLAAAAEAAEAGVAEAGSSWWPRLQLGGRYAQFGSALGDAGREWQAGLQLSYPLFTGGARPAARDRAQAEVRLAVAELALGELRLADAADGALAQLEAAAARVSAWQSAVAQSAEVARIEQLALETGGGMQTDYLRAEAELLRARAALTEARHAELVARVELARARGELTTEWIAANVESRP
jgi:outer membrane protein TolC